MVKRTRSSRNLVFGLDLGDKKSDFHTLNRGRKSVGSGEVQTTPDAFKEFFSKHKGATVVFEVGGHSRWVQPFLRSLGLNAIAADPRQIALIAKSYSKDDKKDAYILALAGLSLPELLHPVEHKSSEEFGRLAVLETRDTLVATRTKYVNRIKGLCKAEGCAIRKPGGKNFPQRVRALIPEHLRQAIDPLLELLIQTDLQIVSIEKQLKEIAKHYPVTELMQEISGVGPLTSLCFVLTIGDPQRFKDNRSVGAYLGMTPRKRKSGDSDPQLSITKAGNRNLRRLLVLCANYIMTRHHEGGYLREWALKLCERGGKNAKKRAAVALGRKLAVLMLTLWKSGESFDPERNIANLRAA